MLAVAMNAGLRASEISGSGALTLDLDEGYTDVGVTGDCEASRS